MNVAATALVVAYVVAVLASGAPALAGNDSPRLAAGGWREPLARVDAALARGDTRAAEPPWEEAFRMAMAGRTPEGLLAVGYAYLRIGEARHDRSGAFPRARRLFLSALLQARERRDANGAAAAAEAFASIGDHDVTDRACDIALTLALQRSDQNVLERVMALRSQLWSARRAQNPRQGGDAGTGQSPAAVTISR